MSAFLLDLYPIRGGFCLWFVDGEGRPFCRDVPSPTELFLSGPEWALKKAESVLHRTRLPASPERTVRKELFSDRELPVLRVLLHDPSLHGQAVRLLSGVEGLDLWNADIAPEVQFLLRTGLFPLAPCEVEGEGREVSITPLQDPWETEYATPPLRTVRIRVRGDGRPFSSLELAGEGEHITLDTPDPRELVDRINAFLLRTDPDLLLSEGGDSSILPRLLRLPSLAGRALLLNRDPHAPVRRRRPRSYLTYGRIVRSQGGVFLAGRIHIDLLNSFIYEEAELAGLVEIARLSRLPLQTCARTSVGTAVSAMQVEEALRRGYLIPYRKSEVEAFRTAAHLVERDKGGLVYTPEAGVYGGVAELDFSAMYPSIMARFNVSPETVNCRCCHNRTVPETGYSICARREGIASAVSRRIIERRSYYKRRKGETSGEERHLYDMRQTALKWLGVVSFGYMGYKNHRLGRIEAHEAITAFGREALLRAKETAECRGFTMLHALVDSLWLVRPGAAEEDCIALAEEIEKATGLPISFEGIYRWIAFPPSRSHPSVGVPNRYFGVLRDGTPKVRGIEVRRTDVPPIVRETQRRMLEVLFEARSVEEAREKIPDALRVLEEALFRLERGEVSAKELAVTTTLSKDPSAYLRSTPQAVASRRLERAGAELHPGQAIAYVIGSRREPVEDRAYPLDLLPFDWDYDRQRYTAMLLRAANAILQPFGVRVGGRKRRARHPAGNR